jgi:hypothetical protein
MQNTRSIASTVHDCPISHINSEAPQIYGYQSYFALNDNPMGKRGNEGEHSMPMTLYFAICNFLCLDIVSQTYQEYHLKDLLHPSLSAHLSRCSLGEWLFKHQFN